MSTDHDFLKKYQQIIAEEVNVKEVEVLWWKDTFKQTFSPIGREISSSFGKDTGRIIGAAKSWNAQVQQDWTLLVTQWSDSRTLQPHQFETRVEGLHDDYQAAESWVVVSLDFELTDDLIAEWIAREISRFLNQMRKDADYQIDARVQCSFSTSSPQLIQVINTYSEFLQNEALLSTITQEVLSWDITKTFESEEGSIEFTLRAKS